MPPKRKVAGQKKLEDTVDASPVTKKSRAGKLAEPVIEDGSREELFRQRQAAKTGTPYEPKPRPAAAKEEKDSKPEPAEQDSQAASMEPVEINRAPVLTLWVAAVAQREGHSRESALTFGKAISGMLAQSKGKAIGVIQPKDDEAAGEAKQPSGVQQVTVFGMSVKAVEKDGKLLAVDKGTTAVKPGTVEGYLKRAFGSRLGDATSALQTLADSFSSEEVGDKGYKLYEQFRPSVSSGQAGWGQKGQLELARLHELQGTAS